MRRTALNLAAGAAAKARGANRDSIMQLYSLLSQVLGCCSTIKDAQSNSNSNKEKEQNVLQ